MEEITVEKLKEKFDNSESFLLLDVRETYEYYMSNIGGTLIPIDQLPDRLDELKNNRDQEIIVLCRSGSRSARATELLTENGFSNVKNLKGGINDWARKIDNTLPIY